MEAITVDALLTTAGLSTVTVILVMVLRQVLDLSGQAMDRFGAAIAIGVATVLSLLATLVFGLVSGTDLFQAVLNGIFGGLAAAGGYDVLNGARKATQQ